MRPSSGARRPPDRTPAQPIAELIEAVLQDLAQRLPPPEQEATAEIRALLEREWADVVGPRFVGLVRPGPVSAHSPATLIVWVKHSVALFEAQRSLRDLAQRIRQRWPNAPWRTVQFRLEPTDLTEAGTPPG